MIIKQPSDMNVNGSFELKWNKSFGKIASDNLQKTQEFVDSECMRLMTPYTPMRNGILYKSAMLGTVIGSGEIHQITPYARYQYYGKVYGPNIPVFEGGQLAGFFSPKGKKKYPTGKDLQYSTAKHPQAGPFWFKRMVADKKQVILRGAAKVSGGKAE